MNQDIINKLMTEARAAAEKSYAVYSKIHVGAALLTESRQIITGVNVENSSYGLTICAERNAIGTAVGQGETKFTAIAVYSKEIPAIMPCGACRQVLAEFNPKMQLIMIDKDDKPILKTLDEIFASPFLL